MRRQSGRKLKSVTEPRLGDDVAWLCRVWLDLFAELIYHHVEILRFLPVIRPPYCLENFCMRDRDIWICNQVFQDLELLRSNSDLLPSDQNLAAAEVDANLVEFNDVRTFPWSQRYPAKVGANPCK